MPSAAFGPMLSKHHMRETEMSYRSICIGLLRGDARNQETLDAAAEIAPAQDAHLIGMLFPAIEHPGRQKRGAPFLT